MFIGDGEIWLSMPLNSVPIDQNNTWIPSFKHFIPIGIKIIVQHNAIPRHISNSPAGNLIANHTHAFNNAPVSLNTTQNIIINITRQVNKIIFSYPSGITITSTFYS